jgi:uncharacterized protein YecT (DUF1311 family)
MKVFLLCLGLLASVSAWAGDAVRVFEKNTATDLQLLPAEDGYFQFTYWPEGGAAEMQVYAGSLVPASGGGFREQTEEGQEGFHFKPDGNGWQVTGNAAHAARFAGVYRVANPADVLARARARWEKADALLNAEYEKTLAAADKSRVATLRQLQREWLAHRDFMSAAAPVQSGEENVERPESSASYWNARQDFTIGRIGFLKASDGTAGGPGITGTYKDFFGGELKITEAAGDWNFAISVVRGPSSHLGDIEGTAKPKGKKLTFQDGETPPARIDFTMISPGIVKVDGENTSNYHGMRAHFDGTYYKVSDVVE